MHDHPDHPAPCMEDEALALLRLGFCLVPMHRPTGDGCSCNKGRACRSVGKHPRIKSWTEHASGDEAQVRGWWRRWPDANIGVVTGARSGIVVLDLDGPEGIEAAKRMAAPHGGLPRTLAVRTGGGGFHCLFRWDDARPLGNRVALVPKVDFRGEGGCVIAALSLHRSGRRYAWVPPEGGTEPSVEQILPLPDWLAAAVQRAGPSLAKTRRKRRPMPELSGDDARGAWLQAVVREGAASLESATAGQRHGELYKAAARLGNYAESLGLDSARVGELLHDAARRCGYFESRDRGEYDRVVGDAVSAGLEDPLTVPEDFVRAYDPSAPDDGAWRAGLVRNGYGNVKPCRPNLVAILRHDRKLAGRLCENQLSGATEWRSWPPHLADDPGRTFPSELRDQDVVLLHTVLEEEYGFALGREPLADAVSVVAAHHRYHPVREYLEGLAWDGAGRLDAWLTTYCGAEDGIYTRGVGSRWMLAAVARAMEPGCKVDNVLLLEGAQGVKKSGVPEVLGGAWTADSLPSLTTKDAASYLRGVWIVELAELAGLHRTEWNTIKAFLTRRRDRFRPAYGRREITQPRQCVFLGTVNDAEYLGDPTGARRFWPVRVSRVDERALVRDRDQLWAEAYVRYQANERWWLDADLDAELVAAARVEQEGRYVSDAFEPIVTAYVEGRSEVTIDEIFRHAAWPDGARPRMARADQSRVVNVLTRLGFRKTRPRRNGQRVVIYVRDGVGEDVSDEGPGNVIPLGRAVGDGTAGTAGSGR